jgi:hypothetical protein
MSQTYFETEDAVVIISDAGRAKCDAEQRITPHDPQHAEILMWTLVATVASIALLVLKRILGA